MSIIMFSGRPGTGKTYSLVCTALQLLNSGRVVYSNFLIRWDGYDERSNWWLRLLDNLRIREAQQFPASNLKSWSSLSDLMKIEGADILMDEAHFYFNSRRWKEMPFEFMRKLAQHRKDGVNIYGTVQNIARIDLVVRELIDWWYDCNKAPFWITATEYDIDEDRKKRYPLRAKRFLLKKTRYNAYDTLQKIEVKAVPVAS